MRQIKIGPHTINLDSELVEKYEQLTCGKIEVFAENYVCLGFHKKTLEEAIEGRSAEDIKNIILDYIQAELDIIE